MPDKHWGTSEGFGQQPARGGRFPRMQPVSYVDGKLQITKEYQADTMTYTAYGPLKDFPCLVWRLYAQSACKWGTDVASTKATVPNSTFVVTRNLKEASNGH